MLLELNQVSKAFGGVAAVDAVSFAVAEASITALILLVPSILFMLFVERFLKADVLDLKMNYPVLLGLDRDDVQDAYGPMLGIPVSVLISRDGRVCGRHTGLAAKDRFEYEIKSLL